MEERGHLLVLLPPDSAEIEGDRVTPKDIVATACAFLTHDLFTRAHSSTKKTDQLLIRTTVDPDRPMSRRRRYPARGEDARKPVVVVFCGSWR